MKSTGKTAKASLLEFLKSESKIIESNIHWYLKMREDMGAEDLRAWIICKIKEYAKALAIDQKSQLLLELVEDEFLPKPSIDPLIEEEIKTRKTEIALLLLDQRALLYSEDENILEKLVLGLYQDNNVCFEILQHVITANDDRVMDALTPKALSKFMQLHSENLDTTYHKLRNYLNTKEAAKIKVFKQACLEGIKKGGEHLHVFQDALILLNECNHTIDLSQLAIEQQWHLLARLHVVTTFNLRTCVYNDINEVLGRESVKSWSDNGFAERVLSKFLTNGLRLQTERMLMQIKDGKPLLPQVTDRYLQLFTLVKAKYGEKVQYPYLKDTSKGKLGLGEITIIGEVQGNCDAPSFLTFGRNWKLINSKLVPSAPEYGSSLTMFYPDVQDETGNTLLHYAVKNYHLAFVEQLLNFPARADIPNDEQQTAAYLALETGNLETVKLFVDAGAITKELAEEYLKKNYLNPGSSYLRRNLKKIGAKTQLHQYIKENDTKQVLELILNNQFIAEGALNYRDINGDTPLIAAVRIGQDKIVEALLEKGVLVNERNMQDYNALEYAIISKSYPIFHMLLACKNIDLEGYCEDKKWIYPPLGLAIELEDQRWIHSPLGLAIELDDYQMVRNLLDHGAARTLDIELERYGTTARKLALNYNHANQAILDYEQELMKETPPEGKEELWEEIQSKLRYQEQKLRLDQEKIVQLEKEVESLKDQLGEKDEHLAQEQADLQAKAQEVESLKDQLGEKDEQLAQKKADLQTKAQEVESLKSELGKKDEQLAQKKVDLQAKAQEVESLKSELNKKDEQLTQKQADLKAKVQKVESFKPIYVGLGFATTATIGLSIGAVLEANSSTALIYPELLKMLANNQEAIAILAIFAVVTVTLAGIIGNKVGGIILTS